jgi:hypothetical protein
MADEYSAAEEIADTSVKRPHVVVLGAGASLAATPNGDRNGRQLPLMANLVDVVELRETLKKHKLDQFTDQNFEDLYSKIHSDPNNASALSEIEAIIESYFSSLALPNTPTIYDYLVLSLRPKDVIATFNWDPFLFAACQRNHQVAPMPRLIFLHGSVSIGFCEAHRLKGPRHSVCPKCETPLQASKLLYPVAQKDYADDPFLKAEWEVLRARLRDAFAIAIFGYSAPKSDHEALDLMKEAWGDTSSRELEQTEIIDITKDELTTSWSPFIHTHHYDVHREFADSWLRHHPRRSCEALW